VKAEIERRRVDIEELVIRIPMDEVQAARGPLTTLHPFYTNLVRTIRAALGTPQLGDSCWCKGFPCNCRS
jgi:GTP1/Obg family GTP-binding protein